MAKQALHGLKVLEFGEHVSAPYCGKLLGDMGAEVIKIETPSIGDKSRKRGPFPNNLPHSEKSGTFLYLNTNKMGITLDPTTYTGKKIFYELVKQTNILIENHPVKKMKELELDYETLKEINPSLIMTSITPFGQVGAHKDYKAHDFNSNFAGGLVYNSLSTTVNRPTKAGGSFADYSSGLTAALATMGAQFACGGNGTGQHIDLSKQEAIIALQRVISVVFPNEGFNDFSLASKTSAMGGLMRCKDGYVIITNAEDHQWKAFVKLLGEPEWAMGSEYETTFSRAEHIHKINPLIDEWMLNHTKEEIYHQGQAFSCPVAMVDTIEEIVESKQMEARDFFIEIDHKEAGKLKYPQAAYKFSETPWAINRPAPLLGEHNEEIYCKRLGYTKEDLVKLAESGVI